MEKVVLFIFMFLSSWKVHDPTVLCVELVCLTVASINTRAFWVVLGMLIVLKNIYCSFHKEY